MTLKSAIRKINNPGGFASMIDRGTVLSVDKNAATCSVQLITDDTCILEDVKLNPVINDGDASQLGFILFPAIDSYVIIGQVDNDNTDVVVLKVSQVESISLDTKTALNLLIDANGNINLNSVKMVFNDGKNGGLPLSNPLADAISKLQKKVDDLLDAFASHTHPGVQTGSDVSAASLVVKPDKTSVYLKPEDIQNKVILQ
jgi:hypothetical protein